MLIFAPMVTGSFRRVLPWLGFAGILILYVVSIVRLHPTNYFGLTLDDTTYFSSAQALAQGERIHTARSSWDAAGDGIPHTLPMDSVLGVAVESLFSG